MNKNIIPQHIRNNTKFFDHDEEETTLDRQLDKFLKNVNSKEEIIAYTQEADNSVSIIWTTNYVLFKSRGMVGNSYLGWMPRNPGQLKWVI